MLFFTSRLSHCHAPQVMHCNPCLHNYPRLTKEKAYIPGQGRSEGGVAKVRGLGRQKDQGKGRDRDKRKEERGVERG